MNSSNIIQIKQSSRKYFQKPKQPPGVFVKKNVFLKTGPEGTEPLLKRDSNTGASLWNSKNTYFEEQLQTTASTETHVFRTLSNIKDESPEGPVPYTQFFKVEKL